MSTAASGAAGATPRASTAGEAPARAGRVLGILLVGAAVANINMSIANVALPDIAVALDADQAAQNLIADAYTLALAATVLYLGAIGDRYGRRRLLVAGAALSVPASVVAAYAPTVPVLVGARLVGGVAAALLFPTTLSLISALWRGAGRGRAIAWWSGVGGSAAFLGSVVAGALLLRFWWGSAFLFTVPFAVLVAVAGGLVVPPDTDLETEPVDHLGGLLSVVGVSALVLGVQELSSGIGVTLVSSVALGLVALLLFVLRQRRVAHPLLDLELAGQRTFWVAAVAGTVSFGALLGALYIGQQFTRNVLRYDSFASAATTIPAALMFLLCSGPASTWMRRRGGRSTLSLGIAAMGLGFLVMAVAWAPGAALWTVLLPYAVLGCGVAFAGAAASTAIMSSLPTRRAGMGSAVTDLTRDFGGAFIQAVMASILTVMYSRFMMAGFAALPPEEAARTGQELAGRIAGSFQTAEQVAAGYPAASAEGLMQAASQGFSDGKTWALVVAVGLVALSLVCVRWLYPRPDEEAATFARAAADDAA